MRCAPARAKSSSVAVIALASSVASVVSVISFSIGGVPFPRMAPGSWGLTAYCPQKGTSPFSLIHNFRRYLNNVVLDLNSFKLGGLSAGPGTQATGIFASNRQNLTIKNGTIRGFLRGILLIDSGASQGHIVEDIRADQNTVIGIQVEGAGTIVRNNQVVAKIGRA